MSLLDKVNVIAGKGLSVNDYTDAEKSKLAGVATGATKITVTDSLTSTSKTNALSAAQGKALQDNKANKAAPEPINIDIINECRAYGSAGGCYYQKNDSGLVLLNFAIARVDDEPFPTSGYFVPFIMPVGFRPSKTVRLTANYSTYLLENENTPSSAGAFGCYLQSSGELRVNLTPKDAKVIMGSAVFYASTV